MVLAVAAILLAGCGHPEPPVQTSAAIAVPPPTSTAATPPPPPITPAEFDAVGRLVAEAVAQQRLPGAVVQIGHAGQIAYRQAFGLRMLAPAEPMTTDTLFDLASLTKSIGTATAVLQLYERGELQLDDPLQSHLPGFNPPATRAAPR